MENLKRSDIDGMNSKSASKNSLQSCWFPEENRLPPFNLLTSFLSCDALTAILEFSEEKI